MGCTYEELGIFGRLRKIDKLGPCKTPFGLEPSYSLLTS